MRRHGMLLVVLVLAGGLCGCDFSPATERGEIAGSQPGGAAGAAPSGDFLAQWLEIANQGVQQWDVPRASLLVNQMAQSGPEGLEPMFKLLEDPAGKPEPKVLATMTILPLLRPESVPRLLAMTEPKNEVTTRSCATQMLGMLASPEAEARTRALMKDPVLEVQFAAVYCLLRDGDAEAVSIMPELWKRPELSKNQRDSLISSIPMSAAAMAAAVCREAATDARLLPENRRHAIEILVSQGDAESLAVLEKCAQSDPDAGVRDFAKAGLEAAKARSASAPAAAPAPAQ